MKKFILGAFLLSSVFSFSFGVGAETAHPPVCQEPCLENPYY